MRCSGGPWSYPQEGEAQTEKMTEREAQGFSESGSDVGGSAPPSQARGAAVQPKGICAEGAGGWGTRRTQPTS